MGIVLLPSRLCFCDNLLPVRGAFGVPLWLRSLSTLLPLVLALLRVVALSDEGLEINVGVHACAWRACAFCALCALCALCVCVCVCVCVHEHALSQKWFI